MIITVKELLDVVGVGTDFWVRTADCFDTSNGVE